MKSIGRNVLLSVLILRFKSIILISVLLVAALCSSASAIDISLIGGISRASDSNVGTGLHGSVRFEPYLGKHLWLAVTPSYTYFTESFYLVDIPLVISGQVRISSSRQFRIGGGVGAAFSDLSEWKVDNRAVTARFTFRYYDDNLFDSRLVPELVLSGSATSTGNTMFVTLRFGYRL